MLDAWRNAVQTTIEVEESLLTRAMQETGEATQSGAVVAALRFLLQMRAQARILDLRGKVHWEGDLDAMRRDRSGE